MNRNIPFKKTKLLFPNLSRLWSFSRHLRNQNLEINTANNVLICDCSDDEFEKAITEYGANKFEEEIDHNDRSR